MQLRDTLAQLRTQAFAAPEFHPHYFAAANAAPDPIGRALSLLAAETMAAAERPTRPQGVLAPRLPQLLECLGELAELAHAWLLETAVDVEAARAHARRAVMANLLDDVEVCLGVRAAQRLLHAQLLDAADSAAGRWRRTRGRGRGPRASGSAGRAVGAGPQYVRPLVGAAARLRTAARLRVCRRVCRARALPACAAP
jgi:hypothetical protein